MDIWLCNVRPWLLTPICAKQADKKCKGREKRYVQPAKLEFAKHAGASSSEACASALSIAEDTILKVLKQAKINGKIIVEDLSSNVLETSTYPRISGLESTG